MAVSRSVEAGVAIELGWDMGETMQYYFDLDEDEFEEETKPDGTPVTGADKIINRDTIQFFTQRGRRVAGEEGGTTEYGDPDAEYLDPLDGTRNFLRARAAGLRNSHAAYSLGGVDEGQFTRGVANFPLLTVPRMYWAERGRGAYRIMERDGEERRLEVDTELESGIVLVSERYRPYMKPLVEQEGLRAVRCGGAVFKACAVADPSIMETQAKIVLGAGEQIIGFLSDNAHAHDYAAAVTIVREAGGIACNLTGGELQLTTGRHGCIFANNENVRDRLLEVMRQVS